MASYRESTAILLGFSRFPQKTDSKTSVKSAIYEIFPEEFPGDGTGNQFAPTGDLIRANRELIHANREFSQNAKRGRVRRSAGRDDARRRRGR
jgi:hypothetical protein